MEIELDLFKRVLSIDGVEQKCICAGEKWYGDTMPEMGEHQGCGNLVRLILIAHDLEVALEIEIKKIVILPEQRKGLWQKKEMTIDKTLIEFWSDKKEMEVPWMKVHEVTSLLRKHEGKIEDINWREYWNKGGGKACRGFDLKYIPKRTIRPIELDKETREKVQKFVDDLPYDQVKAEWDRKQETSERTIMVEVDGKVPPIPQTKFSESVSESTVSSEAEKAPDAL